MTDLLPVIFARGQNEGVDPRLAPPDVHAVAQNVRWRKDGRPAKKYGVTSVTTTGVTYASQPVNALTSWDGVPVMASGSLVQMLSASGWSAPPGGDDALLSHFAPSDRNPVARDESFAINNPSSGTAAGLIVHAWDGGGGGVLACVRNTAGALVLPTQLILGTASSVRCISTTNFVYLLSKSGTTLNLHVFDPSARTFTALASPGTLDAVGSYFDAVGRGSDFLITYQSAALTVTTKLFSAIAVPALVQTLNTAVAVTLTKVGVAGTSTSNVFVAVQDPSIGQIKVQVFNNALTASLGVVIVEADVNNNAQPGMVVVSNTEVIAVWGGFVAATASSYMRAVKLTAAGVATSITTYFGMSPASKPFVGPAAPLGTEIDGPYVWVATHNADNGSTKWDSQRAYLLVHFHVFVNVLPPRRQLHIPNVIPSSTGQLHLSDVLNLGTGIGYMVPLLNALRFGNGQAANFGVDAVSFRSIYESVAQAVRDVTIAGRVLQFSGGSLFEFNGDVAEETGFSNFPVIQSITGGGGGALTGGATYIYRAVYEWIDAQGRRHRSASSDPVSFATGANSSATLVMKPIVADSHSNIITDHKITLHVYRTLAGQSTFHRVTPNVSPPRGSTVGIATVSYTDLMADTVAAGQEFIYTDGGVADNTLCPPHTFQAVCNGRLWAGGQFDRCVLSASKLLVDGEPSQFSDLEAFNPFVPQDCTGLASIDGTVVAFAREKIYLLTGDGPNDQGVGSFNPPTELPTDVGCSDWRSVLETSLGVLFLAKRGFHLLPRGFNTPIFIGAEVEDTRATYPYIVSSCLVSIPSASSTTLGEITARFVMGNSANTPTATVTLVYDLRTGGWSVDPGIAANPVTMSGTWSDTYIESKTLAALTLHAETPGSYAESSGVFTTTRLGTGDIRPFGAAGFGQFCGVVLVGEYRGASFVTVAVSVDGVASDSFTFSVTAADAVDGSVYLDVTPKIQKGAAIRVTCSDAGNPNSGTPTEGFIMQALFIETELIGKTKRLAAARRA